MVYGYKTKMKKNKNMYKENFLTKMSDGAARAMAGKKRK